MRVRSHLIAGQQAKPAGENPSEYARSVLEGLAGTLQGEVKNLRLWSLVRFKGDGFSNWLLINQKPQA
jgi:hypothetical protein